MDRAIFIKCGKHAKVNQSKVLLKDVAEVYCADAVLANKAKVVPITHLKKVGSRKVLSVLYVMAQVQKELPGVVFQSVGETDMNIEIDDTAWYVFTRNNLMDNPELDDLGVSYDYMYDLMYDNGIYLDAIILYSDSDEYLELFLRNKSRPQRDRMGIFNYFAPLKKIGVFINN
jgi:hypothetical protein